jgi:competence ComEA-like helix-hairpin-helix protein
VKKAFFPLLSVVFVIVCAVLVYMERNSTPVYVGVIEVVAAPDGETAVLHDEHEKPVIININTADLEQLMTLQGIGEVIGQRIIDYREDSGLFMAIEEIMEVPGIGERIFENIKDKIFV